MSTFVHIISATGGKVREDHVEGGHDDLLFAWMLALMGRWRLHDDDRPTRFGWTPGADSWKQFVYPAHQEVLRITQGRGVEVVLDMVAGDYVARNMKCLAEDGRHVTIAVQDFAFMGGSLGMAAGERLQPLQFLQAAQNQDVPGRRHRTGRAHQPARQDAALRQPGFQERRADQPEFAVDDRLGGTRIPVCYPCPTMG